MCLVLDGEPLSENQRGFIRFILGKGGGDYLFAKVATEVTRGPEVRLSTEHFGEFQFHAGDAE